MVKSTHGGSHKPAASRGKECKLSPETVQCPHLHFKTDVINRTGLTKEQHLNLLCTPKGYRWALEGMESGDEAADGAEASNTAPKRIVCGGRRLRKPEKTYVHNFLAEVWTLLTPEMIDHLKGILMNEFSMSPEEAQQFIFNQRELNITKSTTVGLYKKPRKLKDGTVVMDSYVKRRKPGRELCEMYPKTTIGPRNAWLKDFSDLLSEKMTSYVLDAMCAGRNQRQQEIAETLLDRFNSLLEQKASMRNPKKNIHKLMVTVADRLSLWLDQNVPISPKGVEQMKELEAQLDLMKTEEEEAEMELEEEVGEIEEVEYQEGEGDQEREEEIDERVEGPTLDDMGDRRRVDEEEVSGEKDEADEKGLEYQPEEGLLEDEMEETKLTDESMKDQVEDTEDLTEKSPEGAVEDEDEEVVDASEVPQEEVAPMEEEVTEQEEAEKPVEEVETPVVEAETPVVEAETPVEEAETPVEEVAEVVTEDQPSPEKEQPEQKVDEPVEEQEVVPQQEEDEGQKEGGVVAEEEEADLEVDRPPIEEEEEVAELDEVPVEEEKTLIDEDEGYLEEEEGFPYKTDEAEFGEEELKTTDLADLDEEEQRELDEVQEVEEKEEELTPVVVDEDERKKQKDEKESELSRKVIEAMASSIGETPETTTPRQEALKDIIEKDLEKTVGDEDREVVSDLAGKVGTWIDQTVSQIEEEYGTRRRPGSPVAQRAKGPIFRVRRISDKDAYFDVEPISHTRAAKKIMEARRLAAVESLESPAALRDWAEWATEVTELAQKWAQWIQSTAQEARDDNQHDLEGRTQFREIRGRDAAEFRVSKKKMDKEAEAWRRLASQRVKQGQQ